MAIIVPEYDRRITLQVPRAARGAVSGPNAAAFDDSAARMTAQAVKDIGDTVAEVAGNMQARQQEAQKRKKERERVERLSNLQLGFERGTNELLNGKVDDKGLTVVPGLLSSQGENALGAAKTYYEKGGEIKQKYLSQAQTPEEYEYLNGLFSGQFEQNYNRTIRHQLTEERKSADRAAAAYFDSAAGRAGAITRPQDMRAHLDGVYEIVDSNARGKGLTQEETSALRFQNANANMTAAVHGAVWNGNVPAARNLLTQLKSDMLPDDWNKLNWYVKQAEEAQAHAAAKGGTVADGEDVLYQRAIVQLAKDPQAFQAEIKGAGNNLYAFQQRFEKDTGLSVSAKELKSYLDWAQKLLDDPNGAVGQQKLANYAASKTTYDAFEISDEEEGYKVYNKDLDSPSALAGAASDLRERILAGSFTTEDTKKAQADLDNLRRALGARIIKKPDFSWFSTSGDEWVQNKLKKLADGPGDIDFPVEDVAGMYENAVRLAAERNVDLTAPYKDGPKILEQLFDDVRKEFAAAKYGVPVGVVDAALYNGRIMELSAEPKAQKEGYYKDITGAIAKYKAGEWNGRRARVKKDGTEIVDVFFED